jgi:hypothetical protein
MSRAILIITSIASLLSILRGQHAAGIVFITCLRYRIIDLDQVRPSYTIIEDERPNPIA